ncbi:hypothetical protein [Priestia filamentosa]|uniref:hypothetical protein n=1 Tax=Priestia filamentosa TaxID=1402861 RepID=UPI000B1470F8|nr:hypothetical protein [Priestia filamentosa]
MNIGDKVLFYSGIHQNFIEGVIISSRFETYGIDTGMSVVIYKHKDELRKV